MSKIQTVIELVGQPGKIIFPLAERGLLNWMDDKLYLKLAYKCETGKRLSIENPSLFTEKLQWLKLYDRNDRYIKLVDKVLVKEYVSEKIGTDHIIPTIGIWSSFDDIDFSKLPNRFVLKCNHDSGSIIKCYDKSSFDYKNAERKINNCLRKNPFYWGREWPYKHVAKKILAEELLVESSCQEDLRDYKFYCFNGKAVYCQVISDRTNDEKIDFFDINWIHQPFIGLNVSSKNSKKEIKKPKTFEKMVEFADILSDGIPFCRVDFYEVKQKLYFGEITFYPRAGFGGFKPCIWDKILGDMLVIK